MDAFVVWMPPLAALIMTAVCLPMWWERVPPNRWYGARVCTAFRSREDWYAINRAVGRVGAIAGLAAALGGALAAALPGPPELRTGIAAALVALAVLAMLLATFLVGRQRKAIKPRGK
jgi:hypothetical protein